MSHPEEARAREVGSERTVVAVRPLPGAEVHVRVRRPRPAVCSVATTVVICGVGVAWSAMSSTAREFVEGVEAMW